MRDVHMTLHAWQHFFERRDPEEVALRKLAVHEVVAREDAAHPDLRPPSADVGDDAREVVAGVQVHEVELRVGDPGGRRHAVRGHDLRPALAQRVGQPCLAMRPVLSPRIASVDVGDVHVEQLARACILLRLARAPLVHEAEPLAPPRLQETLRVDARLHADLHSLPVQAQAVQERGEVRARLREVLLQAAAAHGIGVLQLLRCLSGEHAGTEQCQARQ
mmetsp:Transcript_140938/g.450672  ORF Transcript_140938/g.450672 Transcript_140938/m.450672 type:complete len:219 (+) Transcript_140938:495-1151(+)